MPAALCPLSAQTQFDVTGLPLTGGSVEVLNYQTTTRSAIFADAGSAAALPNPVPLTGSGRVPPIFLSTGTYTFRVLDAAGALIETVAGIPATATSDDTIIPPTPPVIPTGMVIAYNAAGSPSGWVRCNGRTLGGVSSGATEYAGADASDLFQLLWNSTSLVSTVSGGAGISGAADFAAGKTIQLPDYRGRAPYGTLGMGTTGSGLSTVLTSNSIGTSQLDQVGSTFGGETIGLSIAELPSHNHGVSVTAEAGDHVHTVGTEVAGAHNHNISVVGVGDHNHTATTDTQGIHNHSATADSQGAHTHPGSTTDAQGGHTHIGTTDPNGGHAHTYNSAYPLNPNAASGGSQNVGNLSDRSTSAVADHTHTFTTGSAGVHTHTPSIVSDGVHSHNITVANSGGHNHNVTVNAAGGHTHTASSDSQGSHTHVVDIATAGGHVHTISESNVGNGNPVTVTSPGFLVTWLIKL